MKNQQKHLARNAFRKSKRINPWDATTVNEPKSVLVMIIQDSISTNVSMKYHSH